MRNILTSHFALRVHALSIDTSRLTTTLLIGQMASSSRQRSRNGPSFSSITSSEATLLPESVHATEIDEYLDIFSDRLSFTAGDVSDEDPEAKKTKIFKYTAALSNLTTGMIRYEIKIETDFSNLRMPMETTVRLPFESFRLFQSPENMERKTFFAVFTEQNYDQHLKNKRSIGQSDRITVHSIRLG